MKKEEAANQINLYLFKSSSCGTTVGCAEDKLKVKYYYTPISWLFIVFMGTTRMPYRIDFTCLKSGEVFESLQDKQRISHYMLYRPK